MKRLFDIAVTLVLLGLLWPLMLVLALLIRAKLGSPVLFRQERAGRQGQPFRLIKFRSMTDARDEKGDLLSDKERLPPFGKWLRASSLDELPELWNVLRGEMSLVGPRPLLMDYLPRYNREQARRHEVRPGLTGWAQVHGRNATSWEERFRHDVWYVEHGNLLLDLRILWLTIAVVFAKEGVSAAGHVTMPPFMGSPEPDAPEAKDADLSSNSDEPAA